jgi:hypothetical protein
MAYNSDKTKSSKSNTAYTAVKDRLYTQTYGMSRPRTTVDVFPTAGMTPYQPVKFIPNTTISQATPQKTFMGIKQSPKMAELDKKIKESLSKIIPNFVKQAGTQIKEGFYGKGEFGGQYDGGLFGMFRPFGVVQKEYTQNRMLDLLAPLNIETGRQVDILTGKKGVDLTAEEKKALRPLTIERTVDKIFGVFDAVPLLGATIRPLKSVAARKIAQLTDAGAISNILKKELPTMPDAAREAISEALVFMKDANKINDFLDEVKVASRVVSPQQPPRRNTPALLIEDAKKYTRPDDFIKAQGTPLYHGTNNTFEIFDKSKIGTQTDSGLFGRGFYFGDSPEFARIAPRGRLAENVMEVYPKSRNFFPIANIQTIDEMANLLNMDNANFIQDANGIVRPKEDFRAKFTDRLQEQGYDGVVVRRGKNAEETVIFEPDNIVTRSQLEKTWQQAQAEKAPYKPAAERGATRVPGKAAEELNFPPAKSPMDEKTVIQRRRAFVKDLRDRFGLSDADLRKINNRDIRLMDNYEFKQFIDGMEQKAVEFAKTRQAKAELMDLLERKDFKKVDNYRRTQGFPTIPNMTEDQLRQYIEDLEQFQTGDTFLTQRQLEVVDRSDLKGIRTLREARERLLVQIKKEPGLENTTIEELENIKVSALDKLRYDTALAEKNPYYNFIVNRIQTKMLTGEAHFLKVQQKVNDLARAANKSRKRGVTGTVRQALIPKHQEIVDYLEAPTPGDKALLATQMTPEELEYANYLRQYYSEAYDHLVKIKELYGSRYVDAYFTHTRRNFLEAWSDDGVINAMREWYTSHKEDMFIANIIDQDTGQILPKSKFFQYTLQRQGGITPSKNVTRVFLQYAQIFERKRVFDEIIPEVDIYTQSLTPTQLTPKGLEVDRKLKTFINEYLNNKKGRRINFGGLIKQSGPADILIRMGNTMVSLLDLGLKLGPSVATAVGDQVTTYQALGKIKYTKAWKRRIWDTGIKRLANKNSNKILKEAEPFIGRNIWTELAEPDQGIMDKALKTVFGAFSQSSVEANKLFLLGNLTKEELKAGKISAERMARLRLEAGRWRDMGRDVKSIVGSTSVGVMSTKYKGWAIPIMRTNITNVLKLINRIKAGKFKETLTSREAAETYRFIETTAVLLMVGSYVISEEKDDTFLGQLKARVYMESLTLLGGSDPTLFLSTPRLVSFMTELANNLKKIATLETYQQKSQWGDVGDLKGVAGLERQFTPGFIKQFKTAEPTSSSNKSSKSNVDFGFGDMSSLSDVGSIDFGFGDMSF